MKTEGRKERNVKALVCVVIALAMISIGLCRGEQSVIYRKAKNICMECIGIG